MQEKMNRIRESSNGFASEKWLKDNGYRNCKNGHLLKLQQFVLEDRAGSPLFLKSRHNSGAALSRSRLQRKSDIVHKRNKSPK